MKSLSIALGALVVGALGSAAQPAAAEALDLIGFTASVANASCNSGTGCAPPTINRGTNIPTSNGGTVSTYNYSFTPISLTSGSATPLASPLFVVEPQNTNGTTETATILFTPSFFLPSNASTGSITIATDFTYDDTTGVDTLIWQETNEVFVTSSSCTGPST